MNTVILKENSESFERAGACLREGGIVAFPTDTVYGLGAIYTDREAVRKIFAAKGRDEGKPLSILVGTVAQVEELAEDIPENAYILMKRFWPGALTLIFKKSGLVPPEVCAGGETIGVRMSADPTVSSLIEAAGAPLAAPSANTSGKRSSTVFEDVLEDLDGRIDMIIDGGECKIGVSSTVLDMSGGEMKILREGTVTKEMLEAAIREG